MTTIEKETKIGLNFVCLPLELELGPLSIYSLTSSVTTALIFFLDEKQLFSLRRRLFQGFSNHSMVIAFFVQEEQRLIG